MSDVATPLELSLIIPAFNESKIILRTLSELADYMAQEMPSTAYEIVVVDDGSTDGMADLVSSAIDDDKVRLVRHHGNKGRGRAVRTGFEHARGAYVICLDSDLSYAPYHIPRLLEPLKRDKADITLASAYHPDGSVANVPASRALLSRWGNRVLSAGTYGKYHTLTCIVRGYTRAAIDQLELISDGKDIHLEIVQKATLFGLRLYEVPADLHWRDRARGKKGKGSLLQRLPFVSMSGTIASHLVYNYVLRPGALLIIPVLLLIFGMTVGGVLMLATWIWMIVHANEPFGLALLFTTLRQTLINGSLTLALMVAASLTCFVFIAFYFASQQNKKNYEDTYVLISRMNARLKEIEKRLDR